MRSCFRLVGEWGPLGVCPKSEIPSVLLGIPWPALRGPLRIHFWKKRRPQPYWGGENSGNALEAPNALNYRAWGIPAVLSSRIPGKALREFPGSLRIFSGISSGKSQPYWGYGPLRVAVFEVLPVLRVGLIGLQILALERFTNSRPRGWVNSACPCLPLKHALKRIWVLVEQHSRRKRNLTHERSHEIAHKKTASTSIVASLFIIVIAYVASGATMRTCV